MFLLKGLIGGILSGFSPSESGSDVKIQVRRSGETIWRDHSFVSDNPDAIQNGAHAASLSIDSVGVRAVDRSGRMDDFR
jgi:hypothetical protein